MKKSAKSEHLIKSKLLLPVNLGNDQSAFNTNYDNFLSKRNGNLTSRNDTKVSSMNYNNIQLLSLKTDNILKSKITGKH